MHITPHWKRFWASTLGVVIGVCAGCGGEQTAGIEGSGAPVAASIVTTGRITGFGSIIVDGVEYATSGATIRIDDQVATEAQLQVGDVVTIKGTLDANGVTGAASDISFTADARGAVSQIDATADTFVVLGQTVKVDDETIFDEGVQASDVTELPANASVQVSGFRKADGTLLASRIDPAASNELQVQGRVQALDSAAHTFQIDALTIDYSGATVSGTLAAGSKATVRGTARGANGALLATRVDVKSSGGGGGNGNATRRLEGVITRYVSNSDFDVDGERVITDSSTQFILHGTTLGPDVQVKVRGTLTSSGALLARKVEAKTHGSAGGLSGSGTGPGMVRGLVDSVSSTAGTLTVLGVAAEVSTITAFEDRSSAKVKAFRLSDVRSGDYVEVRGIFAAGTLNATLVKRDKPENKAYLQGVATNVAGPNFVVLGVTVATDAHTQFKGPVGDFSNKIVKVRGMLNGSALLADQVQIIR